MKPIIPTLLLLFTAQYVLAGDFPPISIDYDDAGLTQITIATNYLIYTTHTLKTNLTALRQDLSSYDRHSSEATLDDKDRQSILDWIRTSDFRNIAHDYPPEDSTSYGAAFKSTLDIKLSGIRHQASWDSTSKCPEIRQAVKLLELMCAEITQRKSVEQSVPGYAAQGASSPEP